MIVTVMFSCLNSSTISLIAHDLPEWTPPPTPIIKGFSFSLLYRPFTFKFYKVPKTPPISPLTPGAVNTL